MNAEALWRRCLETLPDVSAAARKQTLDRVTPRRVTDYGLRVEAPNAFLRDEVRRLYGDRLSQALCALTGMVVEVHVTVAATERAAKSERDALRVASTVARAPQLPPIRRVPKPTFPAAEDDEARARRILRMVCDHYGIRRVRSLGSRSRAFGVLIPREVAMTLIRRHTSYQMSYARIGELCGGRDHSTVINAIGRIGELVMQGNPVADDLDAIESALDVAGLAAHDAPADRAA